MTKKYCKIMLGGAVADASCLFLKWQEKNRVLLRCDISEAHFIQSSDQTTVWRVKWLNPVPEGAKAFDEVEAVEISEEEYIELRAKLDEGLDITDTGENTGGDTDESASEDTDVDAGAAAAAVTDADTGGGIMTADEMRRRIAELETQLRRQSERNDMLEACILEISEVVYAG